MTEGFKFFISGLICGSVLTLWAVMLRRLEKERTRPPNDAEESAHRLGLVDGLQEAEGILSDCASRIIERERLNPNVPYIRAEWETIEVARAEVLGRRLYHQRCADDYL